MNYRFRPINPNQNERNYEHERNQTRNQTPDFYNGNANRDPAETAYDMGPGRPNRRNNCRPRLHYCYSYSGYAYLGDLLTQAPELPTPAAPALLSERNE